MNELSAGIDASRVDLSGKIAWVTGAAGGIGAATATLLRDWGATVIGTDISKDAVNGLWRCDVTDPDEIRGVTDRLQTEYGRLDILVNNAGVLKRQSVLEITEDDWDFIHRVNVRGTFFVAQAAARLMKVSGGGSIINVSSVNADVVSPETVAYASSKGAIKTMTKGLAVALGPDGIRVNSVAPGAITTGINEDRYSNDAMRELVISRSALGRLGKPEDVAPAIGFLASDAARFITGSFLGVHGGWTILG